MSGQVENSLSLLLKSSQKPGRKKKHVAENQELPEHGGDETSQPQACNSPQQEAVRPPKSALIEPPVATRHHPAQRAKTDHSRQPGETEPLEEIQRLGHDASVHYPREIGQSETVGRKYTSISNRTNPFALRGAF